MRRRQFLTSIGAGVIPIAAPAIAQSRPEMTWRLAASWPKSLDTLYGACEVFARRVGEITDRRFQIQFSQRHLQIDNLISGPGQPCQKRPESPSFSTRTA
jgi:TRAP-type mannitol/chloroaromatic compound transport system substrate-binding protein